MSGDLCRRNDARARRAILSGPPTSRVPGPPGFHHCPFRSDTGCMMFEMPTTTDEKLRSERVDLRPRDAALSSATADLPSAMILPSLFWIAAVAPCSLGAEDRHIVTLA